MPSEPKVPSFTSVTRDPETGKVTVRQSSEPTLAQMRAWLERKRLPVGPPDVDLGYSIVTAHNAILDAILAALGEQGDPVAWAWHVEQDGKVVGSEHVIRDPSDGRKMLDYAQATLWQNTRIVVEPLYRAAAPRPTETKETT